MCKYNIFLHSINVKLPLKREMLFDVTTRQRALPFSPLPPQKIVAALYIRPPKDLQFSKYDYVVENY